MNHLIIYSHYDSGSFSYKLKEQLLAQPTANNENTQVIDLYQDGFNPILAGDTVVTYTIKKYQDQLRWADHYSFVFPLWWGQMPAILKGFFDRVFTPGFAFTDWSDSAEGLLGDKTTTLYISTGHSNPHYQASGIHDALRCILQKSVFGQCGIEAKVNFYGNVSQKSEYSDLPIDLQEK